jgi:metal-responsive CopG/Arc/MetJ family transcriptional regulator
MDIPKALYNRVDDYCKSAGIAPSEFIFDAVSEKLSSIHRERRRKPRL